MQTKTESDSIKSFQFRVTLQVQTLKISKGVNFDCRVQWKRHQAKAQTRTVLHKDNQSVFNENLVLQFNIQQNQNTMLYLEKKTDLLPVIVTDSGLKSGGVVRFDLAQPLNNSLMKTEKQLQLSKCPDPKGTIKFSLLYENLGQASVAADDSVLDNLNISTPQTSCSPVRTPNKAETYSFSSVPVPPADFKDHHTNPEQIKLKKIIDSLERRLIDSRNKEQLLKAENDKLKLEITTLQKSLDKKTLEVIEKSKELGVAKAHNDFCNKSSKKLLEKDTQISALTARLAQCEKQLSKTSIVGLSLNKINLSDKSLRAIGDTNSQQAQKYQGSTDSSQQVMRQLEQDKIELQHQLAVSNHRIANIFNVAFETGGPQLLDIIQSCIE